MADAEDLKSSGDFSSWGFDSPPGHQFPIQNEVVRCVGQASACAACIRRRLNPQSPLCLLDRSDDQLPGGLACADVPINSPDTTSSTLRFS